MRNRLQKEKMKLNTEVANSPLTTLLAAPSPPMRLASSPAVNCRKNLVGRDRSLPHRAASAAMSMCAVMRIMAMERTIERAAMVKPVTMATWVTVASPSLS